jgi:hypothetical protein
MRPSLPIRTLFPAAALVVVTLGLAGTAAASERAAVLVCHVGGPGDTRVAAPDLERFLRHLEKTAGLPAGMLHGEYHTRAKRCARYVEAHKPVLAVLDLPTLLAQRKAWAVTPVASVGAADGDRFYVMVAEGGPKDVAALRGKRLLGTLASDPRFISGVVFSGSVDAAAHFQLEQTRRPLKGLRAVARGKTEAALIDGQTHAYLAEAKLPTPLVAIHQSEGLPRLTLAALGEPAPIVAKVKAALPKLCEGEGGELCKRFDARAFTPADPARFDALVKRYGE